MKDIESKVAELMALAVQMAHDYSFVGDDTLPRRKAALESALLTALESASRLPDGWVAVPVEPTDEMVDATYHGQPCSDIYRDMIAARPEVPQTCGVCGLALGDCIGMGEYAPSKCSGRRGAA
jgi:hypothetical protein